MTRDLAHELRLLAEAAPVDDHVTGLLGARAHGMVARIRRRRAARRGATAVLSVAAATFAVLGLAPTHGLEEPPAHAPQETLGLTTSVDSDACGRTLEEIGWTDIGPARLAAREIGAYASGHAGLGLRFALASTAGDTVDTRLGIGDGRVSLTSLERPEAVVVSEDGRIVGVPDGAPDYVRIEANTDGGALLAIGRVAFAMRSCDGPDIPIPAGTHNVRLRQAATLHIEGEGSTSVAVVSRPVAITFPEMADTTFPTCGDTFALEPMDDLAVSLVSPLPSAVGAGEVVDFELALTTASELVYIEARGFAASLVFVQDGIVVGGGPTPIAKGYTGDGPSGAISYGQAAAVGCDGQPLPPGEYSAYPVLDVALTTNTTLVAAPQTLSVR
ncbi:hypothetical protein [Cellulomonas timonensis]|uniref:hypothetical protein n=1 Tax=Cellulomonas timonensis TaxID=1689271 RepID=UPI00082AA3C8|nr:hypothetical protein [Cellulomonas timonensis]